MNPKDLLVAPPQHHSPSTSIRNAQEYVYPDVYVSAGDPNSGPHACVSPVCSSMWPTAHRSYTLQMTSERDILMGKALHLKLGIGRKKMEDFWQGLKGDWKQGNCPKRELPPTRTRTWCPSRAVCCALPASLGWHRQSTGNIFTYLIFMDSKLDFEKYFIIPTNLLRIQ